MADRSLWSMVRDPDMLSVMHNNTLFVQIQEMVR